MRPGQRQTTTFVIRLLPTRICIEILETGRQWSLRRRAIYFVHFAGQYYCELPARVKRV